MGNRSYNNNRHGGDKSLIGLIFEIVAYFVSLSFEVIGVLFKAFFEFLSAVASSLKPADNVRNDQHKTDFGKPDVEYTINDIGKEAASTKESGDSKNNAGDNVKEFKKADSSETQDRAKPEENKHNTEKAHNKDFLIFLFILTIVPVIVTLSMGKLLYAGVIGVAGVGLMLVAGVVISIAGHFRKKSVEQKPQEDDKEQENDDSVEKLIKDAFEKLFVIRKDIDKISDEAIRAKLEVICCTGEKIIGEVRTNPEDLAHVRKFFYYYLDAFGEIVKKYLRLSNFEESSEEVGKLMAETEKAFADIDVIFKDLCEKLLEDDMMNLKAEINVIKNSN